MFSFLGIYLSTKECIFVKGEIIYTFLYTQNLSLLTILKAELWLKMIKLQNKIYMINVMNCLILRQIEHSVMKLFFLLSKGHNLDTLFTQSYISLVKMPNV